MLLHGCCGPTKLHFVCVTKSHFFTTPSVKRNSTAAIVARPRLASEQEGHFFILGKKSNKKRKAAGVSDGNTYVSAAYQKVANLILEEGAVPVMNALKSLFVHIGAAEVEMMDDGSAKCTMKEGFQLPTTLLLPEDIRLQKNDGGVNLGCFLCRVKLAIVAWHGMYDADGGEDTEEMSLCDCCAAYFNLRDYLQPKLLGDVSVAGVLGAIMKQWASHGMSWEISPLRPPSDALSAAARECMTEDDMIALLRACAESGYLSRNLVEHRGDIDRR